MKSANTAAVMVRLRESTVAMLLARRASPDETLDRIVERLAAATEPVPKDQPKAAPKAPNLRISAAPGGRHRAIVLGQELVATTLARLFAGAVDLFHDLDPAVINRLAAMRARKRRFVSRVAAYVHPGRPDLGVLSTVSGWWVSANGGEADVRRAFEALCEAAFLTYGKDIVFPLPSSRSEGTQSPSLTIVTERG